jgi:serine/threonine protein kinase
MVQEIKDLLGVLHANGILHNDIKEDNVMFGEDGELRIIDFGEAFERELNADKIAESSFEALIERDYNKVDDILVRFITQGNNRKPRRAEGAVERRTSVQYDERPEGRPPQERQYEGRSLFGQLSYGGGEEEGGEIGRIRRGSESPRDGGGGGGGGGGIPRGGSGGGGGGGGGSPIGIPGLAFSYGSRPSSPSDADFRSPPRRRLGGGP